jgi:hypothetical protein
VFGLRLVAWAGSTKHCPCPENLHVSSLLWPFSGDTTQRLGSISVCTENLNPNVMVMKFAKDGVQYDASGPLNWARDRGIFIQ